MTALAQKRCPLGQHSGVIGTVRRMTKRAIFRGRLMFPEIWTAFLRVTLIARVVQRLSGQQGVGVRGMRAVAAGTRHLAIEKRV